MTQTKDKGLYLTLKELEKLGIINLKTDKIKIKRKKRKSKKRRIKYISNNDLNYNSIKSNSDFMVGGGSYHQIRSPTILGEQALLNLEVTKQNLLSNKSDLKAQVEPTNLKDLFLEFQQNTAKQIDDAIDQVKIGLGKSTKITNPGDIMEDVGNENIRNTGGRPKDSNYTKDFKARQKEAEKQRKKENAIIIKQQKEAEKQRKKNIIIVKENTFEDAETKEDSSEEMFDTDYDKKLNRNLFDEFTRKQNNNRDMVTGVLIPSPPSRRPLFTNPRSMPVRQNLRGVTRDSETSSNEEL